MAGPAALVVWGTAPTWHGECWCRAEAPWDRGAVVSIGLGVRVSSGFWVTAGGSSHHCSHSWWHWASWASGLLLSRPP